MPVALVTGASKGLGRALAHHLGEAGWTLVLDARTAADLSAVAAELAARGAMAHTVVGDVTDPAHRAELALTVSRIGRLDLLVNNASSLGTTPLPTLGQYPLPDLADIYQVNVFAPVALTQLLLPALRTSSGTVVNVSSDAAVEAYPGWGGYGSTKAAVDQVSAVLAVEEPSLRVYAVDPGDMRTDMHQAAFPDDDISDRPPAAAVAPTFLRLLDQRPPSGRYRASQFSDGELPAAESPAGEFPAGEDGSAQRPEATAGARR